MKQIGLFSDFEFSVAFFGKMLAFGEKCFQTRGMVFQTVTQLPPPNAYNEQVRFHRTELRPIMSLYGRMVAAGEWRDYGISSLKDVAVFSVFRRTSEHALYRIEKCPGLANKQGMYAVVGMDGQILRRAQDLKTVLRVLERNLIRMVD